MSQRRIVKSKASKPNKRHVITLAEGIATQLNFYDADDDDGNCDPIPSSSHQEDVILALAVDRGANKEPNLSQLRVRRRKRTLEKKKEKKPRNNKRDDGSTLALAQPLPAPSPERTSTSERRDLQIDYFSPDSSFSDTSAALSPHDDERIGAVPIRGPGYDPDSSRISDDETNLDEHREDIGTPTTQETREDQSDGGEVLLTAELVKPPELVQAVQLDLEKVKRRTVYALIMGAIVGALVALSTILTRDSDGSIEIGSGTGLVDPRATTSPSPTSAPTPEPIFQWRQMGNVIYGTGYFQYFGNSVALNHNGTIVAIGSDPDTNEQTWITVYRYDIDNNKWIQLGKNSIPHPDGKRTSADETFLSDDGTKLTVYSSQVDLLQRYELVDGTVWQFQKARTLSNTTNWLPGSYRPGEPTVNFGGITVSPDGEYVAVSVLTNSSKGYVVNLGRDLTGYRTGPIALERFGDISISRNGDVLVVGQGGHALVYRYGRNGWILPPTLLNSSSEFSTTSFAGSVAVAGDGQTIAITDSRSFQDAGSISMFQTSRGEWRQTGFLMGNLNAAETLGIGGDIVISDDGRMVGVNSKTGWLNPGSTFYTFQFNGTSWEQNGFVMDFNTDEFPCSLSGDGATLCCGSPFDLSRGDDIGLATVYHFCSTEFYSQQPDNAVCSNATLLTAVDHAFTNSSVHGDTSLVTFQTNLSACEENITSAGLWYQVSTGISQYLAVSACSPDKPKYFEMRLTLFSGSCDSLVCLEDHLVFCRGSDGRERSPLVWSAETGKTYFLFVHGEDEDAIGPFDIQLLSSPLITDGKTCQDGSLLMEDGPTEFGNGVWAEYQVNCWGERQRGRWFRMEAESDGYVAMSLCNALSHWNTWAVSVYVGTCGVHLSCIFAQGNVAPPIGCGDDQWKVTNPWPITRGMEYFILVSGSEIFDLDDSYTSYRTKLVTELVNPPLNDKCDNATELHINGVPIFGDATNATNEEGCSNRPFASKGVWYHVGATDENTTLTVSTCDDGSFGPDIMTAQLSVYTSYSSCQTLSCLGSDYLTCNYVFALSWNAEADLEYFILVETSRPYGIFIMNGTYEVPYLDSWGRPHDNDKVVVSLTGRANNE